MWSVTCWSYGHVPQCQPLSYAAQPVEAVTACWGVAKPAASVVWKSDVHSEQPDRTHDLHSIIPTPFLKDGHIYGVCSYGQLRCLKADTGEQLWETFAATGGKKTDCGSAFLIQQGDRFALGAVVAGQLAFKGGRRARLQLAGDQPVLPAEKRLRQHR